MKICSLLPSATEILFALGLGDQVVGVTHECTFPPEARRKPRVVHSVVEQDQLQSEEIDSMVLDHLRRKESLYRIDATLLNQLHPDLIVTQELCEVCAIDASDVVKSLGALSYRPRLLSLHPHTLAEALEDILVVGEATGRAQEAMRLVQRLKGRIERVGQLVADAPRKPRVFCLEWLKPLMASGHWVPEMVELAGGIEVLGRRGEPSRYVSWDEVIAAQPEMILLMPCGFPIARTRQELSVVTSLPGWDDLPAVRQHRVWLVNGPAYYNCSGPRLVDGVEVFAALIHPDRWQDPRPIGAAEPL